MMGFYSINRELLYQLYYFISKSNIKSGRFIFFRLKLFGFFWGETKIFIILATCNPVISFFKNKIFRILRYFNY